MEGSAAVSDWKAHAARFGDEDRFPVYPGCRFLGGVATYEAAVVAHLRAVFCNDHLFEGPRVTVEAARFAKYDQLGKMSELLGAQVRSASEPALLKAINCFCGAMAAGSTGRLCEVDTPFFSVSCQIFPATSEQVVWIAWARWATDVC